MLNKKFKKISFFSIFLLIGLLLVVTLLKFYYASTETSQTVEHDNLIEQQSPILTNNEQVNEQISVKQLLPTEHTEQEIDPILELLHHMTIEQKIGQLFILGFDGQVYEQAEQLQTWINEYDIGNFIVFKRNINSDEQLTALINKIDEHNKQSIPIWIGIDQEGGVVNRLPTKYSSAEQFAKWDDVLITYTKHSEMARHLIDLGVDMNFGPVLDINSNPNNPVINSRAFGQDADIVSKHTKAVIDAYKDEQLIAVGKHFPGHGDTNDDSHYKLPVINKSWDELLALELLPFQHAISNDIPSIMVGHLLIKDVDDSLPASLSPIIIEQKLVNELGFTGIIMTDDLIMDGILKHHSISDAVTLALNAGVHMVIIGHDKQKQEDAILAVKQAINNEDITIEQLDKKVYTILKYKMSK